MTYATVACRDCLHVDRIPFDDLTVVWQATTRTRWSSHYRYRCRNCQTIQLIPSSYPIVVKLANAGVRVQNIYPPVLEHAEGPPITMRDCLRFQRHLDRLTPERFTR